MSTLPPSTPPPSTPPPSSPPPSTPPPTWTPPGPGPERSEPAWWRRTWVVGVAAGLVGAGLGLVVGVGIGQSAGDDQDPVATATDPGVSDSDDSGDGGLPSAPAPDRAPVLFPRDFQITVNVRQQDCFGTAGCNVTVQIEPTFTGNDDISGHTYDITYALYGSDSQDVLKINTFQLEGDGTATFDSEDFVQTASQSEQVLAIVQSIEPR